MAEYRFTEHVAENGHVRLEWVKDDEEPDPLNFWIVPWQEVVASKDRVRAGEFDDGE